jgi:predicted secreted protein
MSKSTALIAAVVLSLGLAAPMASAAEGAKSNTEVQAELKALKKAVGAGEISMKEYNARKAALLKGK